MDGTISSLFVEINNAPGAATSWDFTFRLNDVDTALTCQIAGAAATSCSDTTNSFTDEVGDIITIGVDETGNTVGTTVRVSFVYATP